MDFRERWKEVSQAKKSLLCVGIDAAEPEQRAELRVESTTDKVAWTLATIDAVAPYAAAIKLNRNYYKDIDRAAMQAITARVHAHGMLAIDDSKLADIGETNDAGIYHARREGYDAITYAPFPGNTEQAAAQARKHGLGLIVLVLMSNPEYGLMKNATIQGQPLYLFLAEEAARCQAAGVVIGATSAQNHIEAKEIAAVAARLPEALVLVPGMGAQGGELGPILGAFGARTLVNVGRAIIYADDPRSQARHYRDMIEALRASL